MQAATAKFLEEHPDQEGRARATHSPLSNYEVDRENAKKNPTSTESEKLQEELEPIDMTTTKSKSTEEPITDKKGLFDDLFTKITDWVKLFTVMLVSLIGLGVVSSALFGIDGGFGVVTNITNLLSSIDGLAGLIVLFLVYYLFIRSDEKEKT